MSDTIQKDAVFEFLGDPKTHRLSTPVSLIKTHGACVFLAGDDVYKVKRSVRFPFMDFSTLEKRRIACENEIAVNKPNAPGVYLGVVPITRHGKALAIGGDGEVVEWAVHLRRFDENNTFDRLAERGALSPALLEKLVCKIIESHRLAPAKRDTGAVAAFFSAACDTFKALQRPDVFPVDEAASLANRAKAELDRLKPLLLHRMELGQVRRCHGDLHLRNIALVDGAPILFDAIEFNDDIATCDILYDLAFLLMDLWERGLREGANLVFNRYLWGCEEEGIVLKGLDAIPLFLALRAAVRAKVLVSLADLSDDDRSSGVADARRYFHVALEFLAQHRLRLVGIGGLSGSGKSSLAAQIARHIGRPPGAIVLRSDIERKRAFGVEELDRLPSEAYTQGASLQTYSRLRDLATIGLEAGQSVIVDAVHSSAEERGELERVAINCGATFTGLWLDAPLEAMRERIGRRKGDASDATPEIVDAQSNFDLGSITWHRLDAGQPLPLTVARAVDLATGA